ncbi:MAG: ABC transporter permease [Bacteroidota bacterium]
MNHEPPKIAQRLLSTFLKDDLKEEVLGDLQEKYENMLKTTSKRKANGNYWYQVVNYIRPFALKRVAGLSLFNTIMFKHDVLISLRSFRRHKRTFLINLLGLACGICAAMLIYLWVFRELSIDQFHAKNDRMYQVLQNAETSAGIMTFEYTPALLASTLKERYAEVESATSYITPDYFEGTSYLIKEKHFFEINEQFVDDGFFDVFSFTMHHGDKRTLHNGPDYVLISESMALKLFGITDVTGETVTFQNELLKKDYKVGGVFRDVPSNSSMEFDVLLNLKEFERMQYDYYFNWNNNSPSTVVVLNDKVHLSTFNKTIYNLVEEFDANAMAKLITQKFTDRHLYGNYDDGQVVGGRIAYVKLFIIIGLVILLIACINFMNLSTAKASTRLKELGVKKTLGASRWSLVKQYFTEAFLIASIASILSLILIAFTLPFFNRLTGSALQLQWDFRLVLGLAGITLLATCLSGSYPAFYLSKLKTLSSLSGRLSGSLNDLWIRRSLVVFQFTAGIVLIAAVLIINRQIDFIQNKNLGYDRDNVLYFSNDGIDDSDVKVLFEEIKNIPGVLSAAGASHNLTGNYGRTGGVRWPGKLPDERLSFINIEAGEGFIETMGIQLKSGRTFDEQYGNDFRDKVIINEMAAEKMKLQNPVGSTIVLWGNERQVIGVVKDFHALSLYEPIEPNIMILSKSDLSQTFVKVQSTAMRDVIGKVESVYAKFSNGSPFNYGFVDEAYKAIYSGEQQVAQLSKLFCGIAIIISCLGLMGLASFVSERRTKEIGIRKVLGSSTFSLIQLLSLDFMRTIVLALAIGIPLSYYLSHQWVQNFAYAIQVKWWYFALVTLMMFLIFSLTVLSQILKVVRTKVVDSLRYE